MKSLRILAVAAAAFAYALIVLGAVVRITGSGMGCGDNWPLCNGHLIPPLNDINTVLEWGHRQVAAALSVLTLLLALLAYLRRSEPGGAGPGGTLRPACMSVALLLVQVLLGAVTVWLELPPTIVMLHLGTAIALIAALTFTALRAGAAGAPPVAAAVPRGGIIAAMAVGGVVILMGGITANLGAGPACQGFPLCSGQLWPSAAESGLPHIHWTHRLLAYGLFFHLLGMGFGFRNKGRHVRIQRGVWIALGVTVLQIIVAAVMVLALLPPVWRTLHVAAGTALWVVLVYLVWLASASGKPTADAPLPV